MNDHWTIASSLLGSALIGIAISLMLLLNGRVTGVSGIVNGILKEKSRPEIVWRLTFILGLIAGGLVLRFLMPGSFGLTSEFSPAKLLISGFLVGFGTVMANGCTSGHGICGISRGSLRSFAATLTFMIFGFFSATALRWLGGF